MAPVNGRPFLEYELELLASHGVDDIVLCVGYKGEMIHEHFGDGGRFGANIRDSSEGDRLLGPIGALKLAEGLLRKSFFVAYGDAYLRLDYRRMMEELLEGDEPAMMAVYRNEGRFGRSDVVVKDGYVTAYDKARHLPGMEWVNFGVTAMKKEALASIERGRVCDEPTFYGGLVKKRGLRAFEVNDRFYEIGSEKSLVEFAEFIFEAGRHGWASGHEPPDGGTAYARSWWERNRLKSSRNRNSTLNGLRFNSASSSLSCCAKTTGTPRDTPAAIVMQSTIDSALSHFSFAASSRNSWTS
jgi:NDP-sugar pyrophosphorylase family protein